MSSEDIAIHVNNLSKCYHIYESPRNRLKQFLLPRLQRVAGSVSKQYYREFWALKDISFEIKKGESVGVIGRNGSGKSTLLQIITGTLSPTEGSVETRGRIAALLELGSGYSPDFTGRENVYLNGSLLGLTRQQIDDKFDAIAAFADIGQYLDQPVRTYSSGMLVRLAFAVQVQVDPDILIVDEALAVGDALFQKRCFQRIEKLVSDGTTLMFVSHDQESVRTLTNRALLLNRGKSTAWGRSSDVVLEYRRQLHEEESTYFSALVMNMGSQVSKSHSELSASKTAAVHTTSPDVTKKQFQRLSFGEGQVRIVDVQTLDDKSKPCSVYYPGDTLRIRVVCEANERATKLNIAVRLRNKEGVKIYSWGTLNQDMVALAANSNAPVFWYRQIASGEIIEILLECQCNLGVNLYEVQAAVSFEATPDYMSQRMLHWVDEAAFFQVLMKKDEYFFGGVADLKMRASW